MAKAAGGRPSIFKPKDGDQTYRILALTKRGQKEFEAKRKWLGKVAKWPGRVSDADVVECFIRGDAATIEYLGQ